MHTMCTTLHYCISLIYFYTRIIFKLKRKVFKVYYIKMRWGINDTKDLPREYLEQGHSQDNYGQVSLLVHGGQNRIGSKYLCKLVLMWMQFGGHGLISFGFSYSICLQSQISPWTLDYIYSPWGSKIDLCQKFIQVHVEVDLKYMYTTCDWHGLFFRETKQ